MTRGTGQKADCSDHKGDSSRQWAATSHVLATVPEYRLRVERPDRRSRCISRPANSDCKFSNPDFTVAGSPMMQRAMTSWITKLAADPTRSDFTFEGTLNEPDARTTSSAAPTTSR